MPQELERKLREEARKKGLKGEKADAYVYGAMRKTGWRPQGQRGRATRLLTGKGK